MAAKRDNAPRGGSSRAQTVEPRTSSRASDPIAIVGRACVLPGALDPAALSRVVLAAEDRIGPAPAGRWRLTRDLALASRESLRDDPMSSDRALSDRGGYVEGFDAVFDASGFRVPAEKLISLDPLFRWVLHAGREALRDAGVATGAAVGKTAAGSARLGAVFGNLSYPSASLSRRAERQWLGAEGRRAELGPVDPRDRFQSGLPAHLLAEALGLEAGALALDAACASSLYAIRLACDRLRAGEADLMLAGGVNAADDLFLHVGFTALGALSPTGRSLPLRAAGDGLLPGEGCAFVALERLSDALAHGRRILGLVRGVGLSNDGRGRGLLAPSAEGQARAVRAAYAESGLDPARVSLVECHATGTPVGDATEIESLGSVYVGREGVPVGSIKASLGHLVTAAGVAGLLKVLAGFEAGRRPPSGGHGAPHAGLERSPFRLVETAEPWDAVGGPRVAAVSSFGFGGNNAHLLVEEWDARKPQVAVTGSVPAPGSASSSDAALAASRPARPAIAIVGIGARVASLGSARAFTSAVLRGESQVRDVAGMGPAAPATEVTLPLQRLRFPPADLEQSLAQQTLLLAAALEATSGLPTTPPERTGVIVGLGCDAEVARYGARWRLAGWQAETGETAPAAPKALAQARDAVVPVLRAAGVVGAMPNIPANRVNGQLDARGPSFTVSAEELSGIRALELGARALAAGDLDLALVGAVDLSVEPVHAAAAAELLPPHRRVPGDAAVVLALRRLEDAVARGEDVLAVLDPPGGNGLPGPAEGAGSPDPLALRVALTGANDRSLTGLFGHAHAASGLVHVAAAAVCLRHRARPGTAGTLAPWSALGTRVATIEVEALGGARGSVRLREHGASGGRVPQLVATGTASESLLSALAAWLEAPEPPVEGPVLRLAAHPAAVRLSRADEPRARGLVAAMTEAPPLPPVYRYARADGARRRPAVPRAPERGSRALHAPVTAPGPRASEAPIPVRGARPEPAAPRHLPGPSALPAAAAAHATPALTLSSAAHATSATAGVVGPRRHMATIAPSREAVLSRIGAYQRRVADVHREFLETQGALHGRFLEMRARSLGVITNPGVPLDVPAAKLSLPQPRAPRPGGAWGGPPRTGAAPTAGRGGARAVRTPARVRPQGVPLLTRTSAAPAAEPRTKRDDASRPAYPAGRTPVGPTFDRKALEVHASGSIASLFGERFAPQDVHTVQVRMPEPPLLLADRVVGIDAEPASMKLGTVWTETDVTWDSWYLNEGYVPAGILIESGQADLFLISYLGVDLLNRGERAYRLLGCELVYEGSLPSPGETIRYEIHVDGHANQGDVRLFFFHYDCRGTDGRPVISVRGGQAGFFTKEELAASGGVLWSAEEAKPAPDARMDPPLVASPPRVLENEALHAWAEGDGLGCFGQGYERLATHVRTPKIQPGRMLLMDRVETLEVAGGPWGRGYLKATLAIHPEQWFFDGHFKNDPCMPGTLMFEGCLQTMSIYLAALGYTLERDGWRFEPRTGDPFKLLCRGQVIPSSKELVYEVFVEEVHDGPHPTLVADLLCTVDGLKAFHARRVALRLVPDWPLTSRPGLAPSAEEEDAATGGRVAVVDGFRFGYASLLACAWGRPSEAFGPMYERFDGTRRVARLPGPPYHFMSRVSALEGAIGNLEPGAEVTIEYDVPEDAWYFDENGCRTMPFAVLLEAVLQPCGWLASYVGSALSVDIDLAFRNLDGTGMVKAEIPPDGGTLVTHVRITNISPSAGIIIEAFDVRATIGDVEVFTLRTVFGFFPKEALENQVGLPTTPEERARLERPSDYIVDLRGRPARYFEGMPRLAGPMLCMIDRVTEFEPTGGKKGLGFLRAEKDVNPSEWFFKAHFFQDPVQPGSLGIEAMLVLLQFYLLETDAGAGIPNARFEPIAIGREVTWKYRGQVQPKNNTIGTTLDVVEVGKDERGVYALCDASLWVDGRRIYEAKSLGMRIVAGGAETRSRDGARVAASTALASAGVRRLGAAAATSGSASDAEETLDPASDTWLLDHRPTLTAPALPMMSVVDRLLGAARAAAGATVLGLADVRLARWIAFTSGALRFRTETTRAGSGISWRNTDGPGILEARLLVHREAPDPRLSRFEAVATARALLRGDEGAETLVPLPPLAHPHEAPDPYDVGILFHGPAFRMLRSLTLGSNGASAMLDAGAGSVPRGTWGQALLDACTHAIPHDRLHVWSDAIGEDVLAYPHRVPRIVFHGEARATGLVRCEVRFDGFDDPPTHRDEPGGTLERRFPRFRVQLLEGPPGASERLLVDMTLVEVLLPKGPIGSAEPLLRREFLRGRAFVPGVGLSRTEDGVTRILRDDVAASDWYPGTLVTVYQAAEPGAELARDIAVKEHVARRVEVHPSWVEVRMEAPAATGRARGATTRRAGVAVAATEPLTLRPVLVEAGADEIVVHDAEAPRLDTDRVRDYWRGRLGVEARLVEDLHRALLGSFLRRVRMPDPETLDAIRGQSALYLANHQVAIESPLFSVAIEALTAVPTAAIAKAEHRASWLGRLIAHVFAYPGVRARDPILYFDRDDPASMGTLLAGVAAEMTAPGGVGRGLLVHVEGTRAKTCRTKVGKVSSALLDLAIRARVAVVPVRFVGGLPVEPEASRLDFPPGMGKQDYVIGRPIPPEELETLAYRARPEAVLVALNAIEPRAEDEAPLGGDATLAARAAAWAERAAEPAYAALLAALEGLADPSEETRAFLAGETPGGGPVGAWTAELARLLLRAR